jgi:para-nitrobenzyl esterase
MRKVNLLVKRHGGMDLNAVQGKVAGAFLAAALLLSLPCRIHAQVVQTDSGPVSGATADGVTSYKGIPYAAPPVGPLRWRPPQPPASWTSVRAATAYGHDCMQLPFPSDAAPLGTTPSEDCLVVNVWVPAKHSAAKLPVMFWIYGGGWVNGGSSPDVYDGKEFAKGGVVLVSINYRLGRFGFFAHPALTKESHGGLLGNYGYMDQIAGLKWVQRNIAAFGGDPKNVTIFGESAGGFSVHMLMTTQLSDGLFERAIVESGGGRTDMRPRAADGLQPRASVSRSRRRTASREMTLRLSRSSARCPPIPSSTA